MDGDQERIVSFVGHSCKSIARKLFCAAPVDCLEIARRRIGQDLAGRAMSTSQLAFAISDNLRENFVNRIDDPEEREAAKESSVQVGLAMVETLLVDSPELIPATQDALEMLSTPYTIQAERAGLVLARA